jgi:hypothetical protein
VTAALWRAFATRTFVIWLALLLPFGVGLLRSVASYLRRGLVTLSASWQEDDRRQQVKVPQS